jgi:uncharacterized protein
LLYFRALWGEVRVKIDLSDIEHEPLTFAEEFSLAEDRLDAARVAAPLAVRLEGSVRPLGDHYLVAGRGAADGQLNCGRCLKPVAWRMSSAFSLEFALTESAPLDPEVALDDGDLDLAYLEEPALDLEELAVEQVLLELPIRVLCAEDCAGLCPSCGADRNSEGACNCKPETDPRWAALEALAEDPPRD